MTDLVQKFREALAKITPRPWFFVKEISRFSDCASYYVATKKKGPIYAEHSIMVCCDDDLERDIPNAKFIAHAPQWLSEAADEIERLRGDLATQDESHQAWMTMAKEHIEQSVQGERELRATIAALSKLLHRCAVGHNDEVNPYIPLDLAFEISETLDSAHKETP